jgi:hypothetical protein
MTPKKESKTAVKKEVKTPKLDITYNEKVNFDMAKLLNTITYEQFTELMKLSKTKRTENYNNEAEYTKLKNYTQLTIDTNNNIKQNYKYAGKKTFGRLYSCGPSIQKLYNGFRGLLCEGITYDVDMQNCHLIIIRNLIKEHKIKRTKYIQEYIDDRDNKIKDLMKDLDISKGEAKCLFLQCLNKHSQTKYYRNKEIKNEFFKNFDKETTRVMEEISNIYYDEYSSYLDDTDEEEFIYNIHGKIQNILLCKKENEYLKIARDYFKEKNINIHTLMYDGCMPYISDNYKIEEVIIELNEIFKPIGITWTIKEHAIDLLEHLMKFDSIEQKPFTGANIEEVAKHILQNELKDKLIRDNKGTLNYMNDRIIIKNKEVINLDLYKYISNGKYSYVKEGKQGPIRIRINEVPCEIKKLVESLISNCNKDDSFNETVFNYTKYKLFFNNGYYDFKTDKFIHGKFNKTFIKVNTNLKLNSNEEKRKEIEDKIFYPIFGIERGKEKEIITEEGKEKEVYKVNYQLYQYLLYRLKRSLGGFTEDKKFITLEGERNCGKGVISDILIQAFEQYITLSNSNNLLMKINKADKDEAKALSWTLPLEFTRICLFQEMSVDPEKPVKLDSSMIKKIASGGDKISARSNNKDEREFSIQATMLICTNDFPEATTTDVKETKDEFIIKSKFIDSKFKEEDKKKDIKYYKKDDTIKEYIKNMDVLNEFTLMILNATECDYPELIKNELDDMDDDNDFTKIKQLFEVTKDKEDTLTNNDLKEYIKSFKLPFTIIKLKRNLVSLGAETYRNSDYRGLSYIKLKE